MLHISFSNLSDNSFVSLTGSAFVREGKLTCRGRHNYPLCATASALLENRDVYIAKEEGRKKIAQESNGSP